MKSLEKISNLNWFENAGKPFASTGVVQVADWDDAVFYCSKATWESVGLDARNELTMHLNRRCKKEFQEWNLVIDKIKHTLNASWSRLSDEVQRLALPSVVLECGRWDTTNAIATEYYEAWQPPEFYLELLRIYLAGHFPCGWSGEWPDGKLLVF